MLLEVTKRYAPQVLLVVSSTLRCWVACVFAAALSLSTADGSEHIFVPQTTITSYAMAKAAGIEIYAAKLGVQDEFEIVVCRRRRGGPQPSMYIVDRHADSGNVHVYLNQPTVEQAYDRVKLVVARRLLSTTELSITERAPQPGAFRAENYRVHLDLVVGMALSKESPFLRQCRG